MENILKELNMQIDKFGDTPHTDKIKHYSTELINVENDWNQFKIHFEQVHTNFFSVLHEHYPQLTPHELKLCAYYRINLNTKEIARLLNISPESVQKSRHRLRKKMSIPSDIDLTVFMSNIS
jgi:DNA-binding CsgD family transcriptional regulator